MWFVSMAVQVCFHYKGQLWCACCHAGEHTKGTSVLETVLKETYFFRDLRSSLTFSHSTFKKCSFPSPLLLAPLLSHCPILRLFSAHPSVHHPSLHNAREEWTRAEMSWLRSPQSLPNAQAVPAHRLQSSPLRSRGSRDERQHCCQDVWHHVHWHQDPTISVIMITTTPKSARSSSTPLEHRQHVHTPPQQTIKRTSVFAPWHNWGSRANLCRHDPDSQAPTRLRPRPRRAPTPRVAEARSLS